MCRKAVNRRPLRTKVRQRTSRLGRVSLYPHHIGRRDRTDEIYFREGPGKFAAVQLQTNRLVDLLSVSFTSLLRLVLELLQIAASIISSAATSIAARANAVFGEVLVHVGEHPTAWFYILATFVVLPVMFSRRGSALTPGTPLDSSKSAEIGTDAEYLVMSSVSSSASDLMADLGAPSHMETLSAGEVEVPLEGVYGRQTVMPPTLDTETSCREVAEELVMSSVSSPASDLVLDFDEPSQMETLSAGEVEDTLEATRGKKTVMPPTSDTETSGGDVKLTSDLEDSESLSYASETISVMDNSDAEWCTSEEPATLPELPLNSYILGDDDAAGGWTKVEKAIKPRRKTFRPFRDAGDSDRMFKTPNNAQDPQQRIMANRPVLTTPLKVMHHRPELSCKPWTPATVRRELQHIETFTTVAAAPETPEVSTAADNSAAATCLLPGLVSACIVEASTTPLPGVSWAKIASAAPAPKPVTLIAITPIKRRMVILGSKAPKAN